MGGVAGTIPVLAQRAASEDPRCTRAIGIIPATPYKVIVHCGLGGCLFEHSAATEQTNERYRINLRPWINER
jgi:hypothetical protein